MSEAEPLLAAPQHASASAWSSNPQGEGWLHPSDHPRLVSLNRLGGAPRMLGGGTAWLTTKKATAGAKPSKVSGDWLILSGSSYSASSMLRHRVGVGEGGLGPAGLGCLHEGNVSAG